MLIFQYNNILIIIKIYLVHRIDKYFYMKIYDLLKYQEEHLDEGAKEKAMAASMAAMLALTPAKTSSSVPKDLPTASQSQEIVQKGKNGLKPFYKIGAPYKIKGKLYKPTFNQNYKETGIASWYGPGFDGKTTANHDVFNQNDLTAAHKTLPIPSVVKVTNLDNGKTIMVTINDRGPYHHDNRIIDLSKAAANKLGFIDKGTANVKVEYDKNATEKHLKQSGLYNQYLKVTNQVDS